MKRSIRTVVVPVAGAGTRMLPATSAIAKCMLPVYAGDQARPIIDYMVEDFAMAGIERVIFVTNERDLPQLKHYFEDMPASLHQYLVHLEKTDTIERERERRASYKLTYQYVAQPTSMYGTTVPVYVAKSLLEGEDYFAVLGGDDFVYHQDGRSEFAAFVRTWNSDKTECAIMGAPVPRREACRYGVLQYDAQGHMSMIDEKPPLERVSESPLVNISRYIYSKDIWPFVDAEIAKDRAGAKGEHFVTYVINDAIQSGVNFKVHRITGKYLDGGSPAGMRELSNFMSENPPLI